MFYEKTGVNKLSVSAFGGNRAVSPKRMTSATALAVIPENKRPLTTAHTKKNSLIPEKLEREMKESILTGIRDQHCISRKSNKNLKKQQIEQEGAKRDAIARIMLS